MTGINCSNIDLNDKICHDTKILLGRKRYIICFLSKRGSKEDDIDKVKRSARSTMDGWCGLRHIGTHPLFHNHQWFSFPLSVEW